MSGKRYTLRALSKPREILGIVVDDVSSTTEGRVILRPPTSDEFYAPDHIIAMRIRKAIHDQRKEREAAEKASSSRKR